MRKRTNLRKKVHTNPSLSSKIMSIEQSICDSHTKEKLYDETLAVTRIKSDPSFSDMPRNLAYVQRLLGPCYILIPTR